MATHLPADMEHVTVVPAGRCQSPCRDTNLCWHVVTSAYCKCASVLSQIHLEVTHHVQEIVSQTRISWTESFLT